MTCRSDAAAGEHGESAQLGLDCTIVAAVRETLHIIEPTLRSHHGHVSSLVAAFAESFGGLTIVHADREARDLSIQGIQNIPRFSRSLRKVMLPWVYIRLLRASERILISTATTADFWALQLAARLARRTLEDVTLFVHWYRGKPSKDRFMSAFARRHPRIALLAPTTECAGALRSLGFRNVTQVPYPFQFVLPHSETVIEGDPHVLVAGGARGDKGFLSVVELLEHIASRGSDMPFTVQMSGDHWGEYGDGIETLAGRLREVRLPRLQVVTEALEPRAYRMLFDGAIVLQPYDAAVFRDRVSGVTLDALNAASPIVTSAGTWTAEIVARFGCGAVCASNAPSSLESAIGLVRTRYPEFRQRAREAREALRKEVERSPVSRILRRNASAAG